MRLRLLVALAGCCLAWPLLAAPPRVATVRTLEAAPRVDGELDDPCWGQATELTDWVRYDTGAPAPLPVTGKLCLDRTHLYVAYRCIEPDPALLRAQARADGEAVRRDDALEVFISPYRQGRSEAILHLMVNSRGFRQIEPLLPDTDPASIRTACKLLPDGWQAEVAIPLAATGVARLGPEVGWQWRFNLNRQRRTAGGEECDYNWSYQQDHWEEVPYLGVLQANPQAPLAVTDWQTPQPGWGSGNRCRLRLQARRECQATLTCRTAAGITRSSARLAAGQARWLEVPYTASAQGAPLNREPLGLQLALGSGVQLALDTAVQVPAALQLFLQEPNYRGFLWPETRQVRGFAELGLTPETLSRARFQVALTRPGAAPIPGSCRLEQGRLVFRADASRLPLGPARLELAALDRQTGKPLVSQAVELRRLSAAERDALPAYIDPYQRLVVAGKPFFPLGWYGGHQVSHLEEVAGAGFNCMLDYSINHLELDQIRAYLDSASRLGMHLIYCNNDLYPQAARGRTKGPWQGDRIVEGMVDTFKDHPALIAWYLNDELPPRMIPELTDYYRRIAQHDPGHPAYIVLCDMPVLPQFTGTTDVMGVDPYPIPRTSVTMVADQADIARRGTRGTQPTWMVLQAFGWYQYAEPAPGSVGGRGRIPTGDELATGREPTFAEERAMTYLALNHGAQGLIYYCYYDHRILPHYRERFAGMTRLAGEVRQLMPALLTTEQARRGTFSCRQAGLDLGVWQHQGHYYLAAVNTTPEERTFTLRGPFAGRAQVLFEGDRRPQVGPGALTDTFSPLQVHVYRVPGG